MARPKNFDEAEVMQKALDLFWARGFKHTSFSDLVTELGVSRQSLYDTYGDKQTLFLRALNAYRTQGVALMRHQLENTKDVNEAFAGVFEGVIAGTCGNGHRGCLMVNSLVELTPHDAEVRAVAQENARQVEGLFASRLSQAHRSGQLAKTTDVMALAKFLHHTILGISVAARALGDANELRQTAQVALQLIK